MSDWTTLTVANEIEELTDRMEAAIDRLTAAIIASNNDHTLCSSYKDDYLDAYRFLEKTKGDSE